MRILLPVVLATTLVLHADDSARALIQRATAHEEARRLADAARDYEADEMLYRAKEFGRNRVEAAVA